MCKVEELITELLKQVLKVEGDLESIRYRLQMLVESVKELGEEE